MQVELSVLTGQIRNAEKGESGGYDEQWQRALEKAYFERQVEVMRSTGPPEVDTGGEDNVSREVQVQVMGDDDSVKRISVDSPPQTEDSFITPVTSLDLAVFLSVGKGFPIASSRAQVGSPAQLLPQSLRSEPNNIEGTEFCREISALVKSALPSASSVKVFAIDDGLHMVIRDVSMNGDRLKTMLTKIRSLIFCANRRLVAVTLNGEQIWENRDQVSIATKGPNIDQRIDHIYY